MKKFSITAKIVTITMGLIGTVYAADQSFSPHSLLNSWTGYYIGADAGVAVNQVEVNSQQLGFSNPSTACNTSSRFSTFFPGVQVGYLYQFSNDWVSGIEANLTLNTNQTETLDCINPYNNTGYDRTSFRNQLQDSIKGRLGRTIDWNNNIFLPYVTAGVSFANLGLTYQNEGGNFYTKNSTSSGWLIGTGIEWAYNRNWSLRAEYSYVNYGTAIDLNLPTVYGLIDPNGGAHAHLTSSNVTLSVNYWV